MPGNTYHPMRSIVVAPSNLSHNPHRCWGLSVVAISLELCTSYTSSSPVVITTSIILCSNKIQNGDILVPVNPGPPVKWRENNSLYYTNLLHCLRKTSTSWMNTFKPLNKTLQIVKRHFYILLTIKNVTMYSNLIPML